ncbi:hypothetical protein Tco_0843578 [Tanacetum coccineum]|uniref:Uncharacterized protein n=1 Tax=Tanacetum coccineum TaxID=301880 RepID=A0ABQ5B3C1_9ASTR
MWTMSNKLKREPITDVKIHPNSKPAVLTVYRNNNKMNFEVHNPFKFGDFGITELDELGPIIEKKKNSIFALPAPIPEQAPYQSSGRKRKHMELEPEIKVPRLECNRSLPEGVPFVNNMSLKNLMMALTIKTPKNARFCLKLKKLIAERPDQEKLKSKKVKLEAVGYLLD